MCVCVCVYVKIYFLLKSYSYFILVKEKLYTPVYRKFKINPLVPNGTICSRIVKISFLKKEGIAEKSCYERRAYESIDDKRLSKALSEN